jgi:catechol 2,3-dioxygenase-like lactoylglutathione lyase family enzyme
MTNSPATNSPDLTKSPEPTNVPELATGITRDIYPMPAFVKLAVADLDATVAWFTEALDFINLFAMPGPNGPALVHLRRWRYQDVLVVPAEGEAPLIAPGLQLTFAARFEEVDALAARARAYGQGSVDGPVDTPWNTRDLTVTSPDGLVVVFTARRPEPLRDPRFTADMERWSREQGLR